MSDIGHNSIQTSVAAGQLRSLVERIERLEEEKKALAGDIREVYAEAKANGFDTKILRKVIAKRKQDANERNEEEAMLELYMNALGMLPLFASAGDGDEDDPEPNEPQEADPPAEEEPEEEEADAIAAESEMPDIPPELQRSGEPAPAAAE